MTTTNTRKKQSNLPATVNFDMPENYDSGIKQEDVQIPSIILLQKMTELVELEEKNWKPGQFYNMATDKVTDSFSGLVVKYFVTVRLLGEKDRSTGRAELLRFSADGIHWNDNGEVINPSEFQYSEEKPFARKSFHYLVLLRGEDMPVMLTFKGASAKMGKRFNTHLIRTVPMWRNYFTFKSTEEENAGNKYHILQAVPMPKKGCSQAEADLCRGFWSLSNESKVVSHEMNETNEEDPVY